MNTTLIDHQNIYEIMANSVVERQRMISLAIRSPTEYKLILLKDVVQDAERVVNVYIRTIGQSDATAKQFEDERKEEADRIGLNNVFSEAASGFNSRLFDLISQISPSTIQKMARAYRIVHFTAHPSHQNPRAVWKLHLWERLQMIGQNIQEKYPEETEVMGMCLTPESIVSHLIHGVMVPVLQNNPLPEEGENLVMLQNERLNYVNHLLLAVSLQMYILCD